MTRRSRITLILVVGALVGGLVIAVSLPGRDDGQPGARFWDRLSCACDEILVKLGLRSENPFKLLVDGIHDASAADTYGCSENLRRLEDAKMRWALETRNLEIPSLPDLVGTNGYNVLRCPAGGDYVIGRVKEKVRCSVPGHTL